MPDVVHRPELSVVIPCYNEEDNAAAIAAAVVAQMEQVSDDFEIIFIDNGSADRTVEIVRGLCARDKRIRLIANTRNFGQLRSPTHAILEGLCHYDAARLKGWALRFTAPVFPGETIITEIWADGSFRARIKERDVIAINNGYATIAKSV